MKLLKIGTRVSFATKWPSLSLAEGYVVGYGTTGTNQYPGINPVYLVCLDKKFPPGMPNLIVAVPDGELQEKN